MNAFRNIFIFSIFLGLALSSCISDDITDSPDATLSFSTDVVSFGTVFTDLNTPTARLQVYNRNKKGVNISSIRFKDPDTPFRLNVDGVNSSFFSDVEIRGNDSIYIFLECFINPDETVDPFLVSDQLEFITNGVTQTVDVEAWAWNVTRLVDFTIDKDLTLTNQRPYIIFGTMTVEPDVTLNIEPGTWLLFHDKAGMEVKGRMEAIGDPENMIRMSGDRLDDILPDVPYDQLAGQWTGINFAPESSGNHLEFVNMRSTVSGITVEPGQDLSQKRLTLINSWLHNSQGHVLYSENAWVDAFGCCFSEAAGSVVKLSGGRHSFIQCTIANAYLFSAYYEPNLYLEHIFEGEGGNEEMPPMAASFDNCIIWGQIGSPIHPGDLIGSDVFLRNVLLKADGSDDENFIDCIWNKDPLYYTNREDYYFDYRLRPDSPAIGKGNPSFVTSECMYDMDGKYRMANGNPALGAYAD